MPRQAERIPGYRPVVNTPLRDVAPEGGCHLKWIRADNGGQVPNNVFRKCVMLMSGGVSQNIDSCPQEASMGEVDGMSYGRSS
jgi:hypothetical protein